MKKTYAASLSNLDEIYADTESFCAKNGVDSASAYALNLCLDEIFTNIVSYGYKGDASKSVEIELYVENDVLVAIMRDTSPSFNPLSEAPKPDTSASVENRDVGGLGIFFLSKNMDSVAYETRDGVNELVMKKNLAATKKQI